METAASTPIRQNRTYTAFEGARRIACGDLRKVAVKVKNAADRGERGPLLIFDDLTSEVIDVDLRGTPANVLARLPNPRPEVPSKEPPRGPGRPKLGVVAREVTLLPRHWEWLNRQPGGASVAIRKLVEEARRANAATERVREAQESAYRFMSTMAGNMPGYEEAIRALFASKRSKFEECVSAWPAGVREHAIRIAEPVFLRTD